MPGIYIHIPFCSSACHYCNFHFSTSLHRLPAMVSAIRQEILEPRFPFEPDFETPIDTIYFGGGTPGILTANQIETLLHAIHTRFNLVPQAEITLEANPDNLLEPHLQDWAKLGINRLSIGVQSFHDSDLIWMNRKHTAQQAIDGILRAQACGFDNISIDLIYGTPHMQLSDWSKNLDQAFALGIPHLSCYALTVEDNTALAHFIKKGKVAAPLPDRQADMFGLLRTRVQQHGFVAYETSNFAKPNFESKHNSQYWSGVPYYGFGPSAHSFNGHQIRSWNIPNNTIYISGMELGQSIHEFETLTVAQRANEIILTTLRTKRGLPINPVANRIGPIEISASLFSRFMKAVQIKINLGQLFWSNERLHIAENALFLADGIASDLFVDER